MSTIVWDGATLAADKQATECGFRQTVTKIRRLNDGGLAGICGTLDAGILAIAYIEGGETPSWLDKDDWPTILLIRPDKTIWRYEKYLTPFQVEDSFMACGSGRDYALAALACGKDAVEAVAIAARFDTSTGMGIDSMTL